MSKASDLFLLLVEPMLSKKTIKEFIGGAIFLSILPFIYFAFADKPYTSNLIDSLGIIFGITFIFALIGGLLIIVFLKKVSPYLVDFYFGLTAIFLCGGYLALSYYEYYYVARHAYLVSPAFIYVTQSIFWGIYLGHALLFIALERKQYNEAKAYQGMARVLEKPWIIIACFILGAVIAVLGFYGVSLFNQRLFAGSEGTKSALLFFFLALGIQLGGGHNFQKMYYMKKYQDYINLEDPYPDQSLFDPVDEELDEEELKK